MSTPTSSLKPWLKWLIACMIVFVLWGLYYSWNKTQIQVDTNKTSYSIGQDILLDGVLEKWNDIGQYTHSMKVGSGVFGIRSKEVNLFDYTGVVTIKGKVSDILNTIPVISVSEIIGKTTIQENPFEYNQKFMYFPSMELWINLASAKGYKVENTQKWMVSILDTQTTDNSEVLKVLSFRCAEKDALKDCKQLLENFAKDEQKSYKNMQGLNFYNLPETNTWIMIKQDQSLGRYIYPKSEEIFNVFINILSFYDEQAIKDIAKVQIDQCKSNSGSLDTLEQGIISYPEKWKAQVRFEGKSNNGQLGSCSFDVRLDSNLEAKLISPWESLEKLSPLKKKEKEDSKDIDKQLASGFLYSGVQATGIDNLALKPLATTGEKVLFASTGTKVSIVWTEIGSWETTTKFLWWLKHQSVRGYALYYSKKGIKFYGQIIDNGTNLWIPGITCSYKVSISPYVSSGDIADVEVYECKGQPSEESLQSKNLSLAGTTGSLSFLIDYKTDVLKDLEVKVE
jgi:hypothetical protein